jgi:hypothetical protein
VAVGDNLPDSFYCCLNPAERSVIRSTVLGLILTLGVGVPLDVWNAFWLGTGHEAAAYREAFLSIYLLQIVTIEGGESPFDAVRPTDSGIDLWASLAVTVLLPGGACLDGCGQSDFP